MLFEKDHTLEAEWFSSVSWNSGYKSPFLLIFLSIQNAKSEKYDVAYEFMKLSGEFGAQSGQSIAQLYINNNNLINFFRESLKTCYIVRIFALLELAGTEPTVCLNYF